LRWRRATPPQLALGEGSGLVVFRIAQEIDPLTRDEWLGANHGVSIFPFTSSKLVARLFAKLTSCAKLGVDPSTTQYAHCPPFEIDSRENRSTKAAELG
jgi:hypothetical protein